MVAQTRKRARNFGAQVTPVEGRTSSVDSSNLLNLPWGIIGQLWPPERTVLGRRVCKVLRQELARHAQEFALVRSVDRYVDEAQITEDLRRLQPSNLCIAWAISRTENDGDVSVDELLRGISSSGVSCALKGLAMPSCNLESAQSFESLSQCTALLHLNMEGNMIGSAKMSQLSDSMAKFSSLSELVLNNASLGSHGAGLVGELLPCWTSMRRLSLGSNHIGREVGTLADGLATCFGLEQLDLSGNRLGNQGMERLVAGLKHCHRLADLDLSRTRIDADGVSCLLSVLPQFTELLQLFLADNPDMGDEGATRIAEGIGQCSTLQFLALDDISMGPEGASRLAGALGECGALTEITLGCNEEMGDRGAEALAAVLPQCPKLTVLIMNNVGMSERGLGVLAAAAAGCPAGLTSLDLSGNPLSSGRGSPGLQEVLAGLTACTALVELRLAAMMIKDRGCTQLAQAVALCSRLQALDLEENELGPPGLKRLGEVLGQSSALTHLSVLANPGAGPKGVGGLVAGLVGCKSLARLELGHTGLGDEGAAALARELVKCSAMTHLDVSGNGIGDAGAERLAEASGRCRTLEAVVLAGNEVSAGCCEKLRGAWGKRVELSSAPPDPYWQDWQDYDDALGGIAGGGLLLAAGNGLGFGLDGFLMLGGGEEEEEEDEGGEEDDEYEGGEGGEGGS